MDPVTKYRLSQHGMLLVQPTGSGKTRKAIEATGQDPTTVVGTASLTKNFENEEQKAFGTHTPRNVSTYQMSARGNELPGGKHLVIDESHNIRNPQTKAFKELMSQRQKYDKALLMTATPVVNEPYDIVPQINLAAGKTILPTDKKEFYKKYYSDVKIQPGLMGRLRGAKPGEFRILKNPKGLQTATRDYVSIADKAEFDKYMPKRHEEVIKVPMTKSQEDIYKSIEGTIPYSVRYKVRENMPPSKQEASNLNAYLSGLRQVANTTAPFVRDQRLAQSTKVTRMMQDLDSELARGGKTIVYSNFLNAGINNIKGQLKARGVDYSEVIGSMSKSKREEAVDKYNTGKSNVMLISGAGSEGLNLPKTTMIQLTEPHWNKVRLHQAASRGIRRGDNPDRTVNIKTYLSTFEDRRPQVAGVRIGFKPKASVDEYLYNLSNTKERESQQLMSALKGSNEKK